MAERSLGRLGAVADTDMSRLVPTFTEMQHLARLAIPSLPTLPQTVEMRENIAQFTGRSGRLTRGGDNDGVLGLGLYNAGFRGIGKLDAAIGVKGDTQGYKTDDTEVLRKVAGHIDPVKDDTRGDVYLAHGKDSVELGSKKFPTKWVVMSSRMPTVGDKKGQWTRSIRNISLAAGQTELVTNEENKMADTNQDIYVTLLEVGQSGEQLQTKQDADVAAQQAIAAAAAAILDAQTAGADVVNLNKTLASVRATYADGKLGDATSAAKALQNSAIDASTVAKKIALEKQADQVRKDSTISPEAKKQMLIDINDQKGVITTNAQAEKAETGIPNIPGGSIGLVAIVGGAVTILALAVVVALKKK